MAFLRLKQIDCPKFWNPTFVCPLYLALLGSFEKVASNGILMADRHLSKSGSLFRLLFFLIVPGEHPLALIFLSVPLVSYSLSINT